MVGREHATLRAGRHSKGPSVSLGRAFTQGHGGGAKLTALSHLPRVPPTDLLPVITEVGREFLILLALFFGGYERIEGTSSSQAGLIGPLT